MSDKKARFSSLGLMSALMGLLAGAIALCLLYFGFKKGGIMRMVSLGAGGAFWLTAVFTESLLYSLLASITASAIVFILISEKFTSLRNTMTAKARLLKSKLNQALDQSGASKNEKS